VFGGKWGGGGVGGGASKGPRGVNWTSWWCVGCGQLGGAEGIGATGKGQEEEQRGRGGGPA